MNTEYKVIKKEIGDLVTYKLYVNDTDYIIEKTYSNDGLIRQFYKSNISVESVVDVWTNRETKPYTDDINNILDDDFLFSDFYLAQYRKQKLVGLSDTHMLDVSPNGYDIKMIKSNCVEFNGTDSHGELSSDFSYANEFYLSFRVNITDFAENRTVFSKSGNNLVFFRTDSFLLLRLEGTTYSTLFTASINTDYIVVIQRDSSNTVTITVNDVLESTINNVTETFQHNNIGSRNNGATQFFKGQIYDIKIGTSSDNIDWHLPLSEGVGSTSYNALDKDDSVTWNGGYSWGLQDNYHYNMINGFIGGAEFNGTSSRIQLDSTFTNPSKNFIIEMEFIPYDLSANINPLLTGFYITENSFNYIDAFSSRSISYNFDVNQIYYIELKFIHVVVNVYNINIYIDNVYIGGFNNFSFLGFSDVGYLSTGTPPFSPITYHYFNGLISYININNEVTQDFTTQNTSDFTYTDTTEIRLPYSDENGNKTHRNLNGHNNAETLLKMETVIPDLQDSSFHYKDGVATEIHFGDILETDNEVFISQIERSKVNIETFLPSNGLFKFKRKSLGFGGLRPFRNLALTIVFLFLNFNLFGQIDYDGHFEHSFIINQLFKNKECDCVYYRIDGTIATKNSTGLVIEKCCNNVIKKIKI